MDEEPATKKRKLSPDREINNHVPQKIISDGQNELNSSTSQGNHQLTGSEHGQTPLATAEDEYTPVAEGKETTPAETAPEISAPLSKNQRKKLLKQQQWEENRSARKLWQKQKDKERRSRKRERAIEEVRNAEQNGDSSLASAKQTQQRIRHFTVPVTFLIDCGFDELMLDKERKSLASQITRCYSDNKDATLRAHLAVSSWNGHVRRRFDQDMHGQYRNWRGFSFHDEDFVTAAEKEKERMLQGGHLRFEGTLSSTYGTANAQREAREQGEIVYLTSEGEETLTELKPYSVYIIGGIVDRNRHKGICFKRAKDQGIRTAKLPIGQYMDMESRKVLATNHVNEIMLKWLEVGDWGKAFMKVIPKRKGGRLKGANDIVEDEAQGTGHDESQDQVSVPADEEVAVDLEAATNTSPLSTKL